MFYSNPEIRGEETSLLAINIKGPHVIKNLLIQTNIIVRLNLKYIRELILFLESIILRIDIPVKL